jgi:hypothetical protein
MTLSGAEVIRLVDRMEQHLKLWPQYIIGPPFERIVLIGVASVDGPQPLSVKLVKTPALQSPVFILTLAYDEGLASAAMDRKNARRWIAQLRSAAGF